MIVKKHPYHVLLLSAKGFSRVVWRMKGSDIIQYGQNDYNSLVADNSCIVCV